MLRQILFKALRHQLAHFEPRWQGMRFSSSSTDRPAKDSDATESEADQAPHNLQADDRMVEASESKGSGGLRRSLSDVLGSDLTMQLALEKERQGPTEADLDALFGAPAGLQTSTSLADTSHDGSHGATHGAGGRLSSSPSSSSSSADAAANPAVVTAADPASKLMHAKYGYAALGGVMPSETALSPASLFALKAQPRLHPSKMFAPGQSYDPSVSSCMLACNLFSKSNACQAKEVGERDYGCNTGVLTCCRTSTVMRRRSKDLEGRGNVSCPSGRCPRQLKSGSWQITR